MIVILLHDPVFGVSAKDQEQDHDQEQESPPNRQPPDARIISDATVGWRFPS
jgi:hypothetical protein